MIYKFFRLKKVYKFCLIFLIVFLNAFLTFEISKLSNPILAAGLIGLINSLILKEYAILSFIAAFIGMSSQPVLFSYFLILLSSFFAIIFWIILRKAPKLGGKAGTIAFLSIIFTNLFRIFKLEILKIQTIELIYLFPSFLTSIFFLFLTVLIREKVRNLKSNAVFASSLIGILWGSIIFFIPIEFLPQISFAASFAGMTSLNLIKNKVNYSILTGFLMTFFFFIFSSIFIGFGGKLGFIAFVANYFTFLLEKKLELNTLKTNSR